MRIIGGIAKGKNLFSPSEKTRPTSDRAREGFFSSLESEFGSMQNLNFLDLYSGSGAVGVEALSRGADFVCSVEQHQDTALVAENNFKLVRGVPGRYEVIAQACEKFLELNPVNQFDIIFLDPPYDLPNSELEEILRKISSKKYLKPNGILAVERESRAKEFSWPSPLVGIKVRAYGQGSIFYGGNSASVSL
jgi:16S rRNA (guanine966-N2)-methyltransferase